MEETESVMLEFGCENKKQIGWPMNGAVNQRVEHIERYDCGLIDQSLVRLPDRSGF